MDMSTESPENPSKTVEPPSEEGVADYTQGYEIRMCVYPDGYEVHGPEPLPQSAEPNGETETGEADAGERVADLGEALKHVIAITKEHPLDGDERQAFDQGYQSEA